MAVTAACRAPFNQGILFNNAVNDDYMGDEGEYWGHSSDDDSSSDHSLGSARTVEKEVMRHETSCARSNQDPREVLMRSISGNGFKERGSMFNKKGQCS